MKTYILIVFLLALSCGRAAEPDRRMHPAVQIFINNHRGGDTNGCSAAFGLRGDMRCGHVGHISDVTWKFLRSSREGDVYRLTRKYPSDSDAPKADTKEVIYSGKPLTPWHDKYQKIILRPRS